jgi:hypothetical protein
MDLNIKPYYDDFDDTKRFTQIVFNPGRAVQARELTQIQSLFKNQLRRLGKGMFINGQKIEGGNIGTGEKEYIKITGIPTEEYVGRQFTNGVTKVVITHIGREITLYNPDGTVLESRDYSKYLYYEHVGTSEGEFLANESIWTEVGSPAINTKIANEVGAVGIGQLAYIDPGVFYMDGEFHHVPAQEIISDHDRTIPSLKLGLALIEDIIRAGDDNTLNDPASGHYNFNAPGADRVRATLTLMTSDTARKDYPLASFIELSRSKKGQIISLPSSPEKNASDLDRVLARRTYDESGNYIVRRFPITASIDSNPDLLETDSYFEKDQVRLRVEPGTAYVLGYRVARASSEFIYTPLIDENDPVNWGTVTGQEYQVEFGPYFLTQPVGVYGSSADYMDGTFPNGFPIVQSGSTFQIQNSSSQSIGTCVIRNFRRTSSAANTISQYEMYFDYPFLSGTESTIATAAAKLVKMESDGSFLGSPITILLQDGIQGNFSSNLLFPLLQGNIKVVSNVTQYINRVGSANNSGDDTLTITVEENSIETFSDNQYVVCAPNVGNVFEVDIQPSMIVSDSHTLQITLPTGSPTGAYEVHYQVKQSNIGNIVKTSQDNTETLSISTMVGNRFALDKTDVHHIKSILDTGGAEVSHKFSFDSGQRDTIYDKAALVYNGGDASELGANIVVIYSYFLRTSTIGTMNVSSYPSQYLYNPIKYNSKTSGKTINLRDAIDVRPLIDEVTPTDIIVPQSSITCTYDYFKSRVDKIVLTTNDTIEVLHGTPSLTPRPSADQVNTLSIYNILIPPYLKNGNDVKFTSIEAKAYTMADIGSLESRISRLEYYTSLSLLEKSAIATAISDSSGTNNAFKNGILTDNFTSHATGDFLNPEYWCAISGGFMTVPTEANNLQFEHSWLTSDASGLTFPNIYDGIKMPTLDASASDTGINFLTGNTTNTDSTTGGVKITKNLYALSYVEKEVLTQTYSSSVININPYNVFRYAGFLELTPSSDSWIDTRNISPLVVELEQGDETAMWNALNAPLALTMEPDIVENKIIGTQFSGWQDNQLECFGSGSTVGWGNRCEFEESRTGTQTIETTESGIIAQISSSPVTTNIGNYVIDTSIITQMRAKDIIFEGKNFKPNEIIDVYFDGINMVNYCSHEIPVPLDNERKIEALDSGSSAIRGAPYITVKISPYMGWNWLDTFGTIAERLVGSWITTYVTDEDSTDTTAEDHSSSTLFRTQPFSAAHDNFNGFNNFRQFNYSVSGEGVIYNDVFSGTYAYVMGVVPDEANQTATIFLTDIVGPEGFNKSYLKNTWSSQWQSKDFGEATNDLKLRVRTPWELSEMISNPQQGTDIALEAQRVMFQQALDVVQWDGIDMVMDAGVVGKYSLPEFPIGGVAANKYHLKTDDFGNVKGVFHMPGGIFSTGTKTLRIQSPSDTTAGEAGYTAFGTLQTKRDTILSYDVPMLSMERISNTSTTFAIVTENRNRRQEWSDPIAQSFLTDFVDDVMDNNGIEHRRAMEEGVYLSSIDIWFARKPDSIGPNKNTVITLELRTMQNGIPTSLVLPGSIVSLHPSDVTSSADAGVIPTATKFSFDSPMYLEYSQEYSFVLLSDCDEYEAFISTIGKPDIATGDVITKQPYIGVMFKSQNGSTWTPMQESDVMFRMNRCKFNNNLKAEIILSPKIEIGADYSSYNLLGNGFDASTYLLNATQGIPENTSIGWEWSKDGSVWNEVIPGVKDIFDGVQTFVDTAASTTNPDGSPNNITEIERIKARPIFLKANLASAYDNITPFVSRERTNMILEYNLHHWYEPFTTGQYLGGEDKLFVGDTRAIAGDRIPGVYITKSVTLNNQANSLRVYSSVFEGITGGVRFYYNTDGAPQQYIEINTRPILSDAFLDLESYRGIIVITTSDNAMPTYAAYESNAQKWESYAIVESYEVQGGTASENTIGRLYLSEINDDAEDNKGFITTHNNDGTTPKKLWIHPMYVNGEGQRHVEFDIQGQGAEITQGLTSVVSDENRLEWKPMMLQSVMGQELEATDIKLDGNPALVSDVGLISSLETRSAIVLHSGDSFAEWELVPAVPNYFRSAQDTGARQSAQTAQSFSTFRVKIELIAKDPLDVPAVKNLRAIAITA